MGYLVPGGVASSGFRVVGTGERASVTVSRAMVLASSVHRWVVGIGSGLRRVAGCGLGAGPGRGRVD